MAPYDPARRSLPQLFTDLLEQFATLFQKEMKLARTELSENISAAGLGIAFIGGGAVLLIPALVILLDAAVAALNEAGFAPYWSALIVGGAAVLVGVILALVGIYRLRLANLLPAKTVEQLRRDAALAKDEARRTVHGDEQRAA